jgi:diphosphomevalonate decarboxylase
VSARVAKAVAHANIALAKYWGKAERTRNLPAVPSLSLTLDALSSTTSVTVDASLENDVVDLDGVAATGRALERVRRMLGEVRETAGSNSHARVSSSNDFPTAAGLASSASGFAALALAATSAYGLPVVPSEVSARARRASASAARSIYGGYVVLGAGAEAAEPVLAAAEFPLAMVIALTASGPKSIGSSEGMLHTEATSPYYSAWLANAPQLFEELRTALLARDLARLGPLVEQSALMMHASMLAARPAIVYFAPGTLRVMERVRALRAAGTLAFFTMDAGPHVKVLTEPGSVAAVTSALSGLEGVLDVRTSGPGPDARLITEPP